MGMDLVSVEGTGDLPFNWQGWRVMDEDEVETALVEML